MLDQIEVFKAGKHRALNGIEYAFTEADLTAIVASYDPAVLAAPLVLGHPKTDDPAWGWAESLTLNDAGVIVCKPEKVDPAFAEGVEAGRYRYVSASLYPPTDPNNPKPGNWYLRHIGFLGAQPPAVKGLAPAFAEAPAAGLVEFAAADASTVQSLFRGIRDWLIEKEGLDTADKVIPSWYIDSLEAYEPGDSFAEATVTAPAGQDTLQGAGGADTVEGGEPQAAAFAERTSALDAREAQIAQREAAFAEERRTLARAEDGAFLDSLVTAGRLPPGQRDRAAALFARLDGDQVFAFAEPHADPRAELRGMLADLGVTIHFAEVSGGDGFDPASAEAVPQIAAEITRIHSEAAARGEPISFSEAAARLGR